MDGKVVSKIHEGGLEVNKYVLIIYVPISAAILNTKYILLFYELESFHRSNQFHFAVY